MSNVFRIFFFFGDLVLLNISIWGSYIVSYTTITTNERINLVYLIIFSNLTWFFLISITNPYGITRGWGVQKALRSQLVYLAAHLLVVAFLIFFFRKSYAPLQVGLMYLFFVPGFFAWKLLVLYIRTSFTEGSVKVRNMILLGEDGLIREVRRYYLQHPDEKLRFLRAFVEDKENLDLDRIQDFCTTNLVHEIFYCVSTVNPTNFRRLIDFGLNRFIRVKVINGTFGKSKNEFSLTNEDRLLEVNHSVVPLDDFWGQFAKRIVDIVFSTLILVFVLSWLVPLIGLLIRIDSKGPIFFVQKRAGLNNNAFNCLKFRTMVINFDADSKQATKDDPRITRIGKFLRKSSLDEFPQFINVLLGDMSLIGPRPHPLKLNEDFERHIHDLQSRHYVKPGITGLAQSMGYRGETRNLIDMKNRIAMDRYYVENWSLWLDIKIIFRTIVSLVKGSENAY
ncbi:MAG TPA: exopolysaccharide biosynthesis polyprenyl glycosylphosphotransferase [Cyclobacteriaceae bacterium]|nr:hypothetical protein [Cytophagales bacterium]HNP78677.1 exopolysaccharide biosynthesis polyprenyl glycosylphosphotransferase [Cyclobacteriaceae bacterium]